MKIGAEDRKKLIAMGVLLLIAIPLVLRAFLSGPSSGPVAAASTAPAASTATASPSFTPAAGVHSKRKKSGIPQLREKTLDPSLRTDTLAAIQKVEYADGVRNIFKMAEAAPPPVIQQTIAPVRPTISDAVPQEPPKPQIPLKYYGFSNWPGEAKKAFLQDGENNFVVVEGDVVERRYKIVKITNNSVLIQDVLNNNQQSIDMVHPQPTGQGF